AAAAARCSSMTLVGATIEQTVKSRPRMIGFTPSGRVRALMWMDSLMSRLDTSTSTVLGMLSAGQIRPMEWRTILSTPPFFRPGETSTIEVHRNFQPHGGAFGQAHEVHMHGAVADRIELYFARDHAGLLAANVQHQERGEEMAGLDTALQGTGIHGHVLGSVGSAIDHARDQ